MGNERLLSEQEIYDIIARLDVAKFQSEGIVWPLFEAQDAKSIAARDKWWRSLLQEVNEANDLKDLQERFAHLLRYTADLEVNQ